MIQEVAAGVVAACVEMLAAVRTDLEVLFSYRTSKAWQGNARQRCDAHLYAL